jgi:hypothetical protein
MRSNIPLAALAPIVLAAILTVPSSAPAAVCGDVSGDSKVTTFDALAVLRTAVGQDVNLTCGHAGDDCDGEIRYLLGRWRFETEFDVLLEDNYDLFAVDEAACLIVGQDLDDSGIVFARAAPDAGYDYALLDPSDTYCDFFFFDRIDVDHVEGIDVLLDADENGCGDEISGVEHFMTGTRLADYGAPATAVDQSGGVKVSIDRTLLEPGTLLRSGTTLPPALRELLDRMQNRSR